MNARATSLADEAERLPPADRIAIVERLLNSLGKTDPEIEQAWADEAERRLDEYLAGGVAGLDTEEVLAKYLKP
jgi:putative addiction module component (TIGR02574 family)